MMDTALELYTALAVGVAVLVCWMIDSWDPTSRHWHLGETIFLGVLLSVMAFMGTGVVFLLMTGPVGR